MFLGIFILVQNQHLQTILILLYTTLRSTSHLFHQFITDFNIFYYRFVCKNNGVLFENDLIQIGVKSEFRQNLGRLAIFYGNKTSEPLTNFTPTISYLEDQSTKLSIQMKPVEPILTAGAQIQQQLNAECIDDYTDAPNMIISFFYNGVPQMITMKLPLTINKFFEPTEMNGESFFARWKNLGGYV